MNRRLAEWFDHYFYCSQRERKGITVLFSLCFLLFAGAWARQTYFSDSEQLDFSEWAAQLAQLDQPADTTEKKMRRQYPARQTAAVLHSESVSMVSLVPFDPNTATAEALQALGLPPQSVQAILKYRAKGGRFRAIADLQKIYHLSDADYQRLEPYIRLAGITETPPAASAAAVAEPFVFDPNTADQATLIQLGLSEKVAGAVVRYREKGGQFRTKSDLAKIYGLPADAYQRLQPYIQLPDTLTRKTATVATVYSSHKKADARIDVNSAKEEDWTQLRGIGAAFARRIIQFRESLGGFVRVEQVGETFGLPDSTFRAILPQLLCAATAPRPLSLNNADEETLRRHPYLRFRHIKAILKYREKSGRFKDINILQTFPEFDDGEQTFQKLRPYLSL